MSRTASELPSEPRDDDSGRAVAESDRCPEPATRADDQTGTQTEAPAGDDVFDQLSEWEAETRGTMVDTLAGRPGKRGRDSGPTLAQGQIVGRYVIIEKLGAGGMGVVYTAYDPELDRRVALKLVRSDSGKKQRLIREAQALARVSHPNVVAIYDVGPFEERVFIAMEYISGQTLRAWLSAEKRELRAVINVFLAAGRGLHAAHEAGLIHRDFKPDNVLISDDGGVFVVDFGLARASLDGESTPIIPIPELYDCTESSDPSGDSDESNDCDDPDIASFVDTGRRLLLEPLTRAGALLGTPRYMSPEQHLRRDADARSDQFSFCVALYEGLYGHKPFKGKTLRELRTEVTAGRIREPERTLRVPTRFRHIVTRGLSLAPEDRYPDVAALLHALARALAVPRKRAIGVALALALTGLLTALWFVRSQPARSPSVCPEPVAQLVGVWDDRVRGDVRASFARSTVGYAPSAHERLAGTLESYARSWSSMHQRACRATHVRGQQSQHLLDLRMLCLERRRRSLRATTELFSAPVDDELVQRSHEIVSALPAIADCADVESLIAVVPLPPDPETRRAIEALNMQLERVQALNAAGRFADALTSAKQVLADASAMDYAPLTGEAHHLVGLLHHELGDDAQSQQHQYAAARMGARANDNRLVARALIEALRSDFYLARMDSASGEQVMRLRPLVEVALERVRDDVALSAEYQFVVGEMLYRLERPVESREYLQRASELRSQAFGDSDSRVAEVLHLLASTLPDDQAERRLELAEQALAIQERALGTDHPTVAETVNLVANYVPDSDPQHAIELYERSRAIFERAFGADSWLVGRALNNQGGAMCQSGRFDDGLATLERGLVIYEREFGAEHCHLVYPLSSIADCQMTRANTELAIAPLQRALKNCDGRALHPTLVAETRFTLARVLARAERVDEALALARAARAALAGQGAQSAEALRRVNVWLAEHEPSQPARP